MKRRERRIGLLGFLAGVRRREGELEGETFHGTRTLEEDEELQLLTVFKASSSGG
jgi:hypothetical protein